MIGGSTYYDENYDKNFKQFMSYDDYLNQKKIQEQFNRNREDFTTTLFKDPYNLVTTNVNNDGHCFTRALSIILYNDDKYYQIIRLAISNYLNENRWIFTSDKFAQSEHKELPQKQNEYIKTFRNTSMWADNFAIVAASQLYQRDIRVYSCYKESKKIYENPEWQSIDFEENPKIILANYAGDAHFDPLLPKDENLRKKQLLNLDVGIFENSRLQQNKIDITVVEKKISSHQDSGVNIGGGGDIGGVNKSSLQQEIIIDLSNTDSIIIKEITSESFTDIYSDTKLYVLESDDFLLQFNDKLSQTQYKIKLLKTFPLTCLQYIQIFDYKIDTSPLLCYDPTGKVINSIDRYTWASSMTITEFISNVIGFRITNAENKYFFDSKYKKGLDFFFKLRIDDEGSKYLGPKKIVATPGTAIMKSRYNSWKELEEHNKNLITKILYPKLIDSELGVYTNNSGNFIIFYLDKYLKLLASASNKYVEYFLNGFFDPNKQVHNYRTFEFDLILIAFGDVFENRWDKRPIYTEEGHKVLNSYLLLLGNNSNNLNNQDKQQNFNNYTTNSKLVNCVKELQKIKNANKQLQEQIEQIKLVNCVKELQKIKNANKQLQEQIDNN